MGCWVLVLGACLVAPARAHQPRDWMVGPTPGGTRVLLDVILPGMQVGLEHREPLYGVANELSLRASSLYTLAFLDNRVDVDLRLLVLSIGGSAGYRNTFRSLEFRDDQGLSLEDRRDLDRSGFVGTTRYPWAEARATLSLPFNDAVVFHSLWTLRREGRPERSYDWRYGLVHDGKPFIGELFLFFKHRDFGAASPMIQLINFDRDSRRHTQVNWGLQYVTRTGILQRNDIFLFQILFHTGDGLGGQDYSDQYGFHLFQVPFNFVMAHRMVFDLYVP